MLKKFRKRINKTVSVPAWCYLILFLLSMAMVFVPFLLLQGDSIGNLFANLGYGIFGSTFVAFLIDCANTIRQRKNDQKDFALLTKDLKEAVYNLVEFREKYNNLVQKSYRNLPYVEWMYKMGDITFEFDEHSFSLLIEIKFYLRVILEMSKKLERQSVILVNNLFIPEDFFYNLGQLITEIEVVVSDGNGDEFALRLFASSIFEKIQNIFPEYKSFWFDEWKVT